MKKLVPMVPIVLLQTLLLHAPAEPPHKAFVPCWDIQVTPVILLLAGDFAKIHFPGGKNGAPKKQDSSDSH